MMLYLVVIGVLSGMVTSLSPCVLPVLPVVLSAGAATRPETTPSRSPGRRRSVNTWLATRARPRWLSRRPTAVAVGLALSFSLSTLFGSLILTAFGLPADLLRNAGIAALVLVGLGLCWPRFGELLGQPFARLRTTAMASDRAGIVLGLGLGVLFVPCAGPVLAAIVVLGAAHRYTLSAFVLTGSFAVGVAIPLLILAHSTRSMSRRLRFLRENSRGLRAACGAVMIIMAVAIAFGLTDSFSRGLPSYAEALQHSIAGTPRATGLLRGLAPGVVNPALNSSPTCDGTTEVLVDCGPAPKLSGISRWLNTADGRAPSIADSRGHVVLIDFWTYSCVNCQRSLPHLEAWYRNYHQAGLDIIGVHTPEFAFEHLPENVMSSAAALGVRYPIGIDNDYATWDAYGNQGWPGDYLVDSTGTIRNIVTGEGRYANTEKLIRQLLVQAHPGIVLPAPTEVRDATPVGAITTETYLGYQHYTPMHIDGPKPIHDVSGVYELPPTVTLGNFALGGTWTDGAEALTAGPEAQLRLHYQARNVYLVLAGQGTVTVTAPGKPPRVLAVSGVPTLYPLITNTSGAPMTIDLSLTPGLHAYDFTFG